MKKIKIKKLKKEKENLNYHLGKKKVEVRRSNQI